MITKILPIIKEAGSIIREGFGSNLSIEFKNNESNLVTNIDKASEEILNNFIKKEFPNHSILCEESGKYEKSSEFIWVIDPLDGTTNFAHGLPIFSISVGLQKNNEIILGIVYDIIRNEMFTAELGSGSFKNDKRIYVSKNDNIMRSLLVTGFPYDIQENNEEALQIFGAFLKNSRAIRRLGSAAIDFCYVAAGVFDGFWETKLHPWDVCAGMLLVEEAGGKVTNFMDKKIDIYSNQFLATNRQIHNKMINVINFKNLKNNVESKN